MKILFLARRFYPDNGGVEKHILEISKVLIKKGHQITVITDSSGKVDKYLGIKIIRLPRYKNDFSKKFKIWIWFVKNRKIVLDSDIIHAHDVFIWYWPLKILFLSKKSFVTFHGYESYPILRKAVIIRKVSEKMANGNIVVGEFMKKWYYTKPNFVIYGAVNLEKKLKVKISKYSAVFIGRLDYHTNVLEYSKTVELVKKNYPDFKFTIIGEGEYRSKLKKYNLLGWKDDPIKFLNKNNFAFVSRYLSILEALSNKKLVFALYDNPVKEDYLKMSPFNKFIIIENNPKLLADKVDYYLKYPLEAEKLTDEGFNWVKNQTWENVVNIYLKLWHGKK